MERSANTTTYRRGQHVAVPADVLDGAGIEDGEELVFEKHDGAVVVRRSFSSDVVDDEIATGGVHRTHSLEEFLAELDSDDEPAQG